MRIILIIMFSIIYQNASAEECGREKACKVGGRSYYARLPDEWDPKVPMPVLMHFHGWARQGKLIVNHRRIAGATRYRGVLLVAPNGLGSTWDFWHEENNDVEFGLEVLKDVAEKWNIDESKIFVSGYSYGSSMAWRFACSAGDVVHSLLAVAGVIDEPSENCVAPVNIRHVHGTTDQVLFYPFAEDGGVEGAVELWIEKNKCKDKADKVKQWRPTEKFLINRHSWTKCKTDKTIILDVHSRGHLIPRGWFAKQLDELL